MRIMQIVRIVAFVIALAGAWSFHSRAAWLTATTSAQSASTAAAIATDYPAGRSDEARLNEARIMRSLMYLCAAGSVLILGRAAGKQGWSEANPHQDGTP